MVSSTLLLQEDGSNPTKPTPRAGRLSNYMPELDGLRAVAILTVILFHLQLPYCSLGWAGVFLFFVLSGFLITGILLDSKESKHYFRNFYVRRALRIFPIYYLTLITLAALAIWKDWPMRAIGWFMVYLQNHLLGINSFEVQFPTAFNHSWSLAVEEQFYFIWPLAVLFLSKRWLGYFCMVLIVGAPLARLLVSSSTHNPFLVFTPLACVVDSLAAGALLAIVYRSRFAERITKTLGYAAVALGAVGCCFIVVYHGSRRFWNPVDYLVEPSITQLLYTTMAMAFAGCIVAALQPNSHCSRILRIGFLRHIGKISYGLYMYHWPLLLLVPFLIRKLVPDGLRFRYSVPIYLATTYLTAFGSWHLLEKRISGLKRHFEYREGGGSRRRWDVLTTG